MRGRHPPKKARTLAEILGSPTVLAIEKAVEQAHAALGYPLQGVRHTDCDLIEGAVDIFLNGVVKEVHIVMFDKTPMLRVEIRHGGKTHKINKGDPLHHLIAQALNGNPLTEHYVKKLLPLLPQDLVAMKMADIENAAAAALQDPKKTGPIHERMAARRAADKEKLLARIREVFKGHDDLVSEAEILQLWRETMVAEVMES
jgi:hypothetical protein